MGGCGWSHNLVISEYKSQNIKRNLPFLSIVTTIHMPKNEENLVLQTFYYKKNETTEKILQISCNAMILVLKVLRIYL